MAQQPAQDLVPQPDGANRAQRAAVNHMARDVILALIRGDIAPREPAHQSPDVAAIAAAAGAAAAAVQAGNRAAPNNRLPVSNMSTACKLCGKMLMVSLTNFDPGRAGLKYCHRSCTTPTVAECVCIEKYMQENYLGEFHLDCPTPGCPNPFIEMKRVSVVKPTEVPSSLLRLATWLVSSFVVWPLIYYPVLVLFSYTNDFIDWHGHPKEFDFPGVPFWTHTPSMGAWMMLSLEEKWLGAIFMYWFTWLVKVSLYVAFSIWPLCWVPVLAKKVWYARYRYR